ncbi:hypothetical protein SKB0092_23680 [Roseomonas mucosa]
MERAAATVGTGATGAVARGATSATEAQGACARPPAGTGPGPDIAAPDLPREENTLPGCSRCRRLFRQSYKSVKTGRISPRFGRVAGPYRDPFQEFQDSVP